MTIIDNQMAEEIAKDQAKEQLKCKHQFEIRHIELLDMDVSICAKCDINEKAYELMKTMPCFNQYHWYKLKCWQCPLSILCQSNKPKETEVKK
jgi:hypothetical protein